MMDAPLQALQTPVEFLKGVGPRRAAVLNKIGIFTLADFLEYRPRRYLDRSTVRFIRNIDTDAETTVMGEVVSVKHIKYGKSRVVVKINDGTGMLEGVWFHSVHAFKNIFKENQLVAFSGKVTRYQTWQMVHPDFDILSDERDQLNTGQTIAVYPSSQALKKAGLSNYALRRIFNLALQKFGDKIPETLPTSLVKRYRLLPREVAYRQMHFPESKEMMRQVERRFKYEELFYLEMMIALRKHFFSSPLSGFPVTIKDGDVKKLLQALPFQLTGAQLRVLKEIRGDLAGGRVMNRLIQGDVGSGKTVVALLAMQFLVAAGYQAALMAPTEILAQQHFINIEDLVAGSGLRVGWLTGSMKAKEKKQIQSEIAAGAFDIVIGTHALIQDEVQFKNLGLVVIDEQHRFGVMQRANLIGKGKAPHVLVMTATPIPRTLAMTIYGDLDVSIIDELPPGRQEIRTYWRTQQALGLVHDFIRKHLAAGEQAYFVYPLVEESEKIDLKAASDMFQVLRQSVFPNARLALLHGRLKMPEKEAIMASFKAGEIDLLVATTVVEVGVDVANATIMVIEHAERFGLSQLHQLRGRVGRGKLQSFCLLITPEEINEVAQQRMSVMQETNDGFRIAEEDLRLRGSGEVFGTRQHGLPELRYADLVTDQKIVATARADAFKIVREDPQLRKQVHADVLRHFKDNFIEKYNLPNIA